MKEKDTLNTNGITPLHIASVKGNVEEVQDLLSQGADINAKDKDGYTPLYYACAINSLAVVKCLIEAGADVNAKSNCGALPLYWASKGEKVAQLKYLIANKLDTDDQDKQEDISFKIDINDPDKQAYISLHIAPAEEKIDIVKYLVEKKTDWSVIQVMPLRIALQIMEENEAITKLLLLKGEKVITQNVHDFIRS